MHPLIQRTFGGLSRECYFRHFIFGLIFPAMIVLAGRGNIHFPLLITLIVNTLLYPYSRFVYETLIGFLLGRNVFFVPAFLMVLVKLMTMAFCWGLAVFIAPVGLAYIYWRTKDVQQN
ncbi:hypothetical protein ACND7Z_003784 [Escherichia coli]